MHPRHRTSAAYGNRSFGPRRGFNRGGASGGPNPRPHPLPPPPPRKADILLQAGRLAAEYLVAKGTLPPHVLPPPERARTSALARLGGADRSRRRFPDDDDDYGRRTSRKRWKARRRSGPYDRSDYGSEWSRENGRDRSYSREDDDDDDDDFAPGFSRSRKDSGSRDEPPALRSEVVEETVPESENYEFVDDTASKVSSSSVKKDTLVETEVDSNKELSDVKASSSEMEEEVKNAENGDSEIKKSMEGECDPESMNDSDLVKLLSFAKVPTKPRSTVAQRNPKVGRVSTAEASNVSECGSSKMAKAFMDEVMAEGDLHSSQDEGSKCPAADNATVHPIQITGQGVGSQLELNQSPLNFETPMAVELTEENKLSQHVDKEEQVVVEQLRDSSPTKVFQVSEYAMRNLGVQQTSQCGEWMSQDEEMIAVVDQEKPVGGDLLPKLETESHVKLEEERKLRPTSFKIRDLNLMESPEITEIHDDPALNHLSTSVPTLGTKREPFVDFTLPLDSNIKNTDKYNQLPGDDKVVPVIDLENDCPVEENACDPSQSMGNSIYSSMDHVLNRTEPAVDLPGIQDGYTLVAPELLGNDISGCPSVQSDLNNLQAGFGLPGAEAFSSDDIYVSLGEIPIGYMEVWDQQNQEYGNFF